MSVLQVSNIHFESTSNNRIQYSGANSILFYIGGVSVATVNSTGFAINSFSGNISFDTSTLFIDSVNNRVGVGNTTPSETLRVQGTASVLGAATLANTLSVTGAATLSNTVAVTGAATFTNTMSVTGSITSNSGVIFASGNTITNYHVSTSAPSGGSDGDVWVVIPA